MEWIVNVEGKKNQRVLVKFEPQGEMIIFIGQYKVLMADWVTPMEHKSRWVDFAVETHPMNIDLETIQEMIGKVLDIMKERLVIYEDLSKSFAIIKNVEVKDENETEEEK